MTTKIETRKFLGEYGRFGGRQVVNVYLVCGHFAEIRKLWKQLDDCDGPEEDAIFKKLGRIPGATEVQS